MNNSELFEFLPAMINDERSLVYTLQSPERIFLLVISFVCGIWGTFMKLFLFYSLTKEKITERPINILIIIDQTIDFLGNLVININTTVKVSAPKHSYNIYIFQHPYANPSFLCLIGFFKEFLHFKF